MNEKISVLQERISVNKEDTMKNWKKGIALLTAVGIMAGMTTGCGGGSGSAGAGAAPAPGGGQTGENGGAGASR